VELSFLPEARRPIAATLAKKSTFLGITNNVKNRSVSSLPYKFKSAKIVFSI
jgi:hypothetical protein